MKACYKANAGKKLLSYRFSPLFGPPCMAH
jgi:hypothetical protein